MKINHYKYPLQLAFFNFVNNKDYHLSDLIRDLEGIEKKAKEEIGYDGTIWWRFFSGDTSATDISDIKSTFKVAHLSMPTRNMEYILESMQISYSLNEEPQIFFDENP